MRKKLKAAVLNPMAAVAMLLLASFGWAEPLPVNTRLGGDFTLPSTQGGEQSLSTFKGRLVLLNFGYTHCPDICPTVLHRMAQVMRHLEKKASNVQPVFVSFDPARDTLPHLKSYVTAFYPDMVAMTGTPEQIAVAAKQYGVVYFQEPGDSAAGKLFAHSDFIYLLDRQGRVRALFNNEQSIDAMSDTVQQLLSEE